MRTTRTWCGAGRKCVRSRSDSAKPSMRTLYSSDTHYGKSGNRKRKRSRSQSPMHASAHLPLRSLAFGSLADDDTLSPRGPIIRNPKKRHQKGRFSSSHLDLTITQTVPKCQGLLTVGHPGHSERSMVDEAPSRFRSSGYKNEYDYRSHFWSRFPSVSI